MSKEIEIPEGYEAKIEGNKVILEPKESEDERIRKDIVTHFELIKAQALYDRQEGSDGIVSSCNEKIAYLEKQKEQKPADLPPGFYFIDLDGNRYYSKEFRYGDMKMKVVENEKSAKWSDEDEKAINDACCFIEEYAGYIKGINREKSSMLFRIAEKLKSLRPSWKPSEEQMKALNAINCHGDLSYIGQQSQLISLYNDLKKLM